MEFQKNLRGTTTSKKRHWQACRTQPHSWVRPRVMWCAGRACRQEVVAGQEWLRGGDGKQTNGQQYNRSLVHKNSLVSSNRTTTVQQHGKMVFRCS